MGLLKAVRGAQYPLVKEFVFSFNDTAVDSVAGGNAKTFGSVFGDALVFDAISLPLGAVVTGGELIVETAYVGPTVSTVKAGVAGNDAIYLGATSLLAAGRTALLLTTPLGSNGGLDLRLTFAHTVANASAGKGRVRVFYTIDGKANELSAN